MTFVWYQYGPWSKHVLVCEILVMSFATRLDLGLSLCSKTKKLSCWVVSIIYEHLCATNVWWCLYGLCWSYNGVSLVFGGGVVCIGGAMEVSTCTCNCVLPINIFAIPTSSHHPPNTLQSCSTYWQQWHWNVAWNFWWKSQ